MLQPVDDESQAPAASPARRLLRLVGPVVALALIGAAAGVLWEMVTSMSLDEVIGSLYDIPTWRLVTAFVLTGVGLAALSSYDLVALQVIRHGLPISFRRALAGGLVANVFANALGLALLSGGTARWRIYSMVGAGLSVIGRLTVMSWVTMWSGILLVLGLTLTLEPSAQAPVFGDHVVDRLVGVGLIVALTGFVGWAGVTRRTIRLGGWSVRMPDARSAAAMIVAGAVDLVAAAGTLYVLLPGDVTPDLARYMVTYSVGLVAGILASTPGGIGVFEATIVAGLDIAADRPDVAAALILFRLIYFVVPLILALLLLGAIELRHRRLRRLREKLGLPTDESPL